ncbi:Uncharacterized conserved protein [Rhodothermus profundi]|uniref:Uncharacterized conserved protein n=1 Tax=Rhodothermus profundi TaxID=633813 RepID=A0A1M6SMH6_9BACT|nr:Uncharacterized conserved protein [Rhodothermus profundi]
MCWSVIQFDLDVCAPIDLGSMPAATIRGALGASLRRLVCITRLSDCTDCPFRWPCIYGYLFETPPPPGGQQLRKLQNVPRPYVVRRPKLHERQFVPGTTLQIELLLIGRARMYLPYLMLALQRLETQGIGRGRREGTGRFRLVLARALRPDGTYDVVYDRTCRQVLAEVPAWRPADLLSSGYPGEVMRLRTNTPLRLKAAGHLVRKLTFRILLRSILSRLSSLAAFHAETTLQLDFASLLRQAEAVRTREDRLQWFDGLQRYSKRQRTTMRLGGLVGEIIFEGISPELWAWLTLGAALHVGHGAVMGLGHYDIEPVS